MFGDGNIADAFLKFSNQHVCNHFCKWFRLPATEATVEVESEV
jgi:hypothetical protein